MKKILPIMLIIVIMGVFIYYYVVQEDSEDQSGSSLVFTEKRILELSKDDAEMLAFTNQVKENPSQVIRTNSLIRKMVYSDTYEDDEIEDLVDMQRQLFDERLLANNLRQYHMSRIKSEVQRWKEVGMKIIGSDYLPPTYQGDDHEQAVVSVVFITNDPNEDIYQDYALTKNDEDQWTIIGWVETDPFEIVK